MISFKEYFLKRVKGGVFFVGGFFSLVMGAIFGATFPNFQFVIWIFLVVGLISLGYGIYLINKIRYERENKSHRVYHYKGGFR